MSGDVGKAATGHERVLRAVEALENGLANVTPGRPEQGRQQVLRDLVDVDECLREHCAAAERRDGTIVDIEITIGRLAEVAGARAEHDRLTALVANLSAAVERDRGTARSRAAQRRHVTRLAEALRRHLLVEVDLLQLRFTLDVGVVD